MTRRSVLLMVIVLLSLVQPVPTPAQNAAFRTSTPISLSLFNPCTNEVVDITGVIDTTVTAASDASGGIHITTHTLIKGKGTGETSGKKYRFISENTFSVSINGPCCQSESTLIQEVVLLSQGASDNQRLQITMHISLDANGNLTTKVEHGQFVCQG